MICGLNIAISLLTAALVYKLVPEDAIQRRLLKRYWKVCLKIPMTATVMRWRVVVKTPKIDLGDQATQFLVNQVLKKAILSI